MSRKKEKNMQNLCKGVMTSSIIVKNASVNGQMAAYFPRKRRIYSEETVELPVEYLGETVESRMKSADGIVENLVESVYNCLYI